MVARMDLEKVTRRSDDQHLKQGEGAPVQYLRRHAKSSPGV